MRYNMTSFLSTTSSWWPKRWQVTQKSSELPHRANQDPEQRVEVGQHVDDHQHTDDDQDVKVEVDVLHQTGELHLE